MTHQDNLNNSLIEAVKECNLIPVKHLIEQGADIHADNDYALRLSAVNGHLETETISIIQTRDLYGKLDDNLNNDIINKHKKKI
jgi:hypothetical protein